MDEDDREYGSSDNEQDELMEDADDAENDTYGEDFNEDEEEEHEEQEDPERDPEPEAELDESQAQNAHDDANAPDQTTSQTAATGTPSASGSGAKWRPTMRPEYITASTYDIVPTMAAPQATSINAVAVTPDMRYWLTGGSDGYIRKFDGIGTINGKQQLTVAQKHPFVDSVVKSGVLMSYWDNQEWTGQNTRDEDRILSPVYSLAVHRQALWALSGLESGGINLQSVRHDEGKKIACLRTNGHTNAVSVLQLAPDEKSVLSGSWDKTVLDWDLNDGSVIRRFEGSGGQIAAIELRPTSGAPIPAEASDPEIITDTFDSNNAKPIPNGFFSNGNGDGDTAGQSNTNDGATNDAASPEHESLFGSPAGSLFGDNETIGGGNAFGDDEDDNEFSRAMGMELKEEQKNQGQTDIDFPMGDAEPLTDTNAAQGSGPDANGAVDNETINMDVSNGDSSHTMSDFGNQATASTDQQQQQPQQEQNSAPQADHEPIPFEPVTTASPSMVYNTAPPPAPQNDETQTAPNIFMAASIDGTIRIWDRRVPDPVARIGNRRGVPPWCMGACWSVDGNWIYAGRRNGTVEEFSIHKARGGWQPERTLKFPNGSGAVSCVRPMPNGRHIICASHDILRLWDLQGETQATKHSKVPFVVVPGPPKAGVISQLYIDPTSRIMISAAGTRGWDGTSTEVLIGYEISPVK
ncbi:WD40-repeat-containing domain protein [Sordaria brevicollis]|uniref:WD40-repeat-containing domain protein n=1 Tax=Sordaria brevicollis TaxID=83679 RepID=A0AAE0P9W6_SORBR|nr:WD40-repeat-containing domain protein [Sordaria brevicollis]